MTHIRGVLALLALAALPAQQPPAAVTQPTDAPRITQEEFKALRAAGRVVVVDTRNVGAFNVGHIPGSLLLPLEGQLTWPDAYQSRVDELKRSTKPVVTYCA